MQTYLIIGNGVAGTTAAEAIRQHDSKGKITVFSEENLPFYHRLRLNEFIAGTIDEEKLVAKKSAWYEEQAITLLTGRRVTAVDPTQKTLNIAGLPPFAFDRLLLATGSHSFVPPIAGANLPGVFTLRTIADARAIAAHAQKTREVVLIGGGLLGLETGNALRRLGKQVTVVEFFPRLLPRQLDNKGAKRLQGILEAMGFSFRLETSSREIQGKGMTQEVLLEGGETLPAQMVIVSAGVRPNLDLAKGLGLACDKGISVNDRFETSLPGIYAAGDVAEHRGTLYGIWPAAMQQGKIAGSNMAGGDALYTGSTMSTVLKVAGIEVAAAGNIDAESRFEAKVVSSESSYRKLVIDDNRIIGCIMVGDTRNFSTITRHIAEKSDIGAIKQSLL